MNNTPQQMKKKFSNGNSIVYVEVEQNLGNINKPELSFYPRKLFTPQNDADIEEEIKRIWNSTEPNKFIMIDYYKGLKQYYSSPNKSNNYNQQLQQLTDPKLQTADLQQQLTESKRQIADLQQQIADLKKKSDDLEKSLNFSQPLDDSVSSFCPFNSSFESITPRQLSSSLYPSSVNFGDTSSSPRRPQEIPMMYNEKELENFPNIAIDLFQKTYGSNGSNHILIYDSLNCPFNKRGLQEGSKNGAMSGILRKENVTIFILTNNKDIFGSHHTNTITPNPNSYNFDNGFFVFTILQNGITFYKKWQPQKKSTKPIKSISVFEDFDPKVEIIEIYNAYSISFQKNIDIDEKFYIKYKSSDSAKSKLVGDEATHAKRIIAVQWV
ncbi:hypothetical protein QTN25_007712 [Entamoeba marina]